MALIELKSLTFAYEGSYDNIFENVSLGIDTSWRLGLVGRNGCGKTTLLKLLQGGLPYEGSIVSPVEFAYFPYPVREPERDARFVAEEAMGDRPLWQLLRELGKLDLSPQLLDRPFSTLSGGEQARLLLAALFAGEERFLLIDEPTNHLDMEGRRLVADYLRGKRGFLLVSHDRDLLDGCVDHILAINRADIVLRQGDFSGWWRDKQQQDAMELEQNQRLKKDIARLEAASRRTKGWSDQVEKSKKGNGAKHGADGGAPVLDRGFIGKKSAKMMQRAKNLQHRQEAAMEEKKGLLKNIEQADALKIQGLSNRPGPMVELKDVAICYDGMPVCEGVRFSLEQGERLALQGPNGCGKSSVLRLILDEQVPYTGQLYRRNGLAVSYVPQDASFLRGSLSGYARQQSIDESLFLTILRKLGFSRLQFEKNMEDYSEGQKKKVLLAASLSQRANLYIWDEPLNYIDLLSRLQIEELLKSADVTMIFVEHDGAFCREIATKTVRLGGNP